MKTNRFYVEAPADFRGGDLLPKIFLGGSITGAWDWQAKVAPPLLDAGWAVFNPRRANFDVLDPKVEDEQITWEHYWLTRVDAIIFYFSHETLAPITLFEYGAALEESKNRPLRIFPCIHPDYKRKRDVIIQTRLRRPDVLNNLTHSLEETIELITASK